MTNNLLLVYLNRCIGCHACEVACKQEHNGSQYVNVATWGPKKLGGSLKKFFIPIFTEECDLCEHLTVKDFKPVCMLACPTKALYFVQEDVKKVMPREGVLHKTS